MATQMKRKRELKAKAKEYLASPIRCVPKDPKFWPQAFIMTKIMQSHHA